MVESKNKANYELDLSLYEVLKERRSDKEEVEPVQVPFEEKELDQVDKARRLKKWKESAGYYNLNPEKFKFSLKNL